MKSIDVFGRNISIKKASFSEANSVSSYIRSQKLLRKFRQISKGIDLTSMVEIKMKKEDLQVLLEEKIIDASVKELDLFEKQVNEGLDTFIQGMRSKKGIKNRKKRNRRR